MLLVPRTCLQNDGSQYVRIKLFLDAILGISAGCVLCLGCGESARGVSSDWNGAQAVHVVGSDHPPPSEQHLRILAVQDEANPCSRFQKARDFELFGVDYLGIYVQDVRAGTHVVTPAGSDHLTADVRLVRAADNARGTRGLAARSGTVTVAFDRLDGPMKVALDVAIDRQTALPLTCVRDRGDSSAETCTCQREDGSSFECTHADPKESACCVTDDPETVPLQAAFTAMPCAADLKD